MRLPSALVGLLMCLSACAWAPAGEPADWLSYPVMNQAQGETTDSSTSLAVDLPSSFGQLDGPLWKTAKLDQSATTAISLVCDHCDAVGGTPSGCDQCMHDNHGLPWPSDWYNYNKYFGRHRGIGLPLEGTSWLNRPHHVDFFAGGYFGDSLVPDHIDLDGGGLFGARFGYDFDHYWGWETRLATASSDLSYELFPAETGSADILLWDNSLLFYPWGDARWRPYLTAGFGVVNFAYDDELGERREMTTLGMPLGGGVKYAYRPWLIWRLDLIDNIALSNGDIETMHNFSLTAGVELRFGSNMPSYWPWNPTTYVK